MGQVLLINASFPRDGLKIYSKLSPPMGLLTIAAQLEETGYGVRLIDPQIEDNYKDKIEIELKDKPIFVGMTVFMGKNILNAVEISKYIKRRSPNTPIVFGGPLATSSPEICFDNAPVDYIVMGVGEYTSVELARTLENGEDATSLPHISTREGRNIKDGYFFNQDIDQLKFPRLDLWEEGVRRMGKIPIMTSRGCPRNCAFCYNNTFIGRKKWFGRSGENVLEEMDYWAEHFRKDKFYFIDDNFLVQSKRACYILEKTIEKKYKINQILGSLYDFTPEVLNCITEDVHHVGFSIESASPKIQKLISKVLSLERAMNLFVFLTEKGIDMITTNFMFGFPEETDEDVRANIEMAVKIREVNKNIRSQPRIYSPQPGDDILSKLEYFNEFVFSIEELSTIDRAPNRSMQLSGEIRPWMSKEDLEFYLDLVLVWFYHFDYVVRDDQDIDVEGILKRNKRLAKLFKNVPTVEEESVKLSKFRTAS
jgi:radical SAM superfamily enzyme YgiQ (UPF0313 family)|tara:strand:+ start:837 stop:2279 length:1443 start_codon:yes stop_codon:yes gene_type:complete